MSRRGGTFADITSPDEGLRVVIASVIRQAQVDVLGVTIDGRKTHVPRVARATAIAYFKGPVYEHHCDMLGLEPVLPADVKEVIGAIKKNGHCANNGHYQKEL